MLIVLRPDATPEQQAALEALVTSHGLVPHAIPGASRTAIGITGNRASLDPGRYQGLPGVAEVISVSQPFKLVSREWKPDDTVVQVRGIPVGGRRVTVVAGPCSVESRDQIFEAGRGVLSAGAHMLRGGAFKPRTSPYEFQGLKEEGLRLMAEVRAETGLAIVTEVKDTATLPLVAEYADILQIGARNMQNFSLLEAVGDLRTPVLLKRGMSATLKELLMAAEYIVARGNPNVILCERGIRTFETMTRNTFDINAIPMLKERSHLPVLADPSHGVGVRSGVAPVARAAIAAGADGVIVEVHPRPIEALSDGHQSLDVAQFAALMKDLARITAAVGREL